MDDATHNTLEIITASLKLWREEHESVFGAIPTPRFFQPVLNFEEKYGLTGISQQYVLPEGLSFRDLHSYAMLSWYRADLTAAQRLDKMTAVWRLLTSYNPELEKIIHDPQDTDTTYHMIMGVAHAFNIDDIQHYISYPALTPRLPELEKSPEFIKLTEVFNRYAATERLSLQWIPAPKTLQLIQAKIASKLRPGL